MQIRRLFPDPASGSAEQLGGGLRLAERAPAERPYVIANMIASADGRASLDGLSAPLGNPADRALFHELRAQVDAVLAGTRTLRVERYGRLVRDPALRARRERDGLAADPLAVVLTQSGNVPWEIPLFGEPEQPVALFGPPGVEPPPACAAPVTLAHGPAVALEPRAVLRHLRASHGVRSLLCEGGPTLLATLAADGLLDELFLCVAPLLAGGADGPRILAGAELPESARLELASVLEFEGALFLRYRVAR